MQKDQKNYWILSLMLTIGMMLFIGYLISKFVVDQLDINYIHDHFLYSASSFCAEKSETITYICFTIGFPIFFFAFYQLLNKLKLKMNQITIDIISGGSFIIFLILAMKIFKIESSNVNALTHLSIPLLAFIFLFLLSIGTMIFCQKENKQIRIVHILFYILSILIISMISYLYINNSYSQSLYDAHHTEAYFYPIYKILCGLTPGIDFDSLYGYYSYFFSMVLHLLGQSNVFYFSCMVSVLVWVAFMSLFYVINKVIQNKFIAFLTLLSVIYVLVIQHFFATGSYYLQYVPHRILFPAMMLLYLVLYTHQRIGNKKWWQLGGYLLSAFALFWNFETGFIVLGVWILSLGYEILFFHSFGDPKTYREIAKILLMVLVTILLYLGMINVITFARTGELIKIQNILFVTNIFFSSGFYMLKMCLWKPWMLLVLIYGIALAISMKKLKIMGEQNNDILYKQYSMIFSLAILGVGIFSYYLGRSHDEVFPFVMYPGMILLGIFLDKMLKNISRSSKIEKIYQVVLSGLILCILLHFSITTIYALRKPRRDNR